MSEQTVGTDRRPNANRQNRVFDRSTCTKAQAAFHAISIRSQLLKYGVRSRAQHLGSGMDLVRVRTAWRRVGTRSETRKVSQHDRFTSLVDRTRSLSVIYNRVFYYDQGQSIVPSFEGMRVSALYFMSLRVLYDVFKNA